MEFSNVHKDTEERIVAIIPITEFRVLAAAAHQRIQKRQEQTLEAHGLDQTLVLFEGGLARTKILYCDPHHLDEIAELLEEYTEPEAGDSVLYTAFRQVAGELAGQVRQEIDVQAFRREVNNRL